MARKTAAQADNAPPTGEMKFPDPASFDTTKQEHPAADPTRQAGRVIGMDYSKWAVATIDLNDRPDRVSDTRQRYAAKGYKMIEGDPIVVGVPNAEVWVLPRDRYEANRQRRAERIQRLVEARVMAPSAVNRPSITRGDQQA